VEARLAGINIIIRTSQTEIISGDTLLIELVGRSVVFIAACAFKNQIKFQAPKKLKRKPNIKNQGVI
jgi:hypothetical protein